MWLIKFMKRCGMSSMQMNVKQAMFSHNLIIPFVGSRYLDRITKISFLGKGHLILIDFIFTMYNFGKYYLISSSHEKKGPKVFPRCFSFHGYTCLLWVRMKILIWLDEDMPPLILMRNLENDCTDKNQIKTVGFITFIVH